MKFDLKVFKSFCIKFYVVNLIFVPHIKRTHLERLAQFLDGYSERIDAISRNYLRKKRSKMSAPRVSQFVTLEALRIAFGLDRGTAFRVFSSPQAGLVRDHIARLTGRFPGLSSAHRRIQQVAKEEGETIVALAGNIQDEFALAVGNGARTAYSDVLASGTRATAPADCFIGIVPPSKAFPGLNPAARGRLLPFLNAWTYMHATRVSGVMELLGELKRPEIAGQEVSFPLAGELGFIAAPPGKNAMYHAFQQIEANLAPLDAIASEQLAGLGAIDLTAASVDTTNVPVDKRDKTGSVGTGSRGTFFGHKAFMGTSATCLPASCVLGSGRQADSSLFEDTFGPMVDLAQATKQDMWVTAVDAGYAHLAVLTRIEEAGAIPLADINPKNSPLLGKLKAKANELVDLSRKAFKKGLTLAERKAWQAEVRAISQKRGAPVPLVEKRPLLTGILRKLAKRARNRGLTYNERRTEKRLRKEMECIRREIRNGGTASERALGLPPVMHGSVEWLLGYAVRGQNEGLNGILKKRGPVIGDGQHTTWVVGGLVVGGRVRGSLAGFKLAALVLVRATGATKHFMRAVHNWTWEVKIFLVLFKS